jgi:uncharacterized protein (DUF1778 family)
MEGPGSQEEHMEHDGRPWESSLLDEAIETAERRLEAERTSASRRAVQLAREQAYHRLAVALDRPPKPSVSPGQLSLFVVEDRLFYDAG